MFKTLTNFISKILNQKYGFSIGEPWRLSKDSFNVIVPILRESKKKRNYITLSEAKNVEINDTGQIDFISIKNKEKKPLYISRGEFFKGKTQERVAIHGYVIQPKKTVRIAVRCIHQSKGINRNAEMTYGGKVPYHINLNNQNGTWNSINDYISNYSTTNMIFSSSLSSYSNTNMNFTGSLSCAAGGFSGTIGNLDIKNGLIVSYNDNIDQWNKISSEFGITINDVNNYPNLKDYSFYTTGNYYIGNKQDDLTSTLESLSDSIKEMMKKIPFIKNQIGAIFINKNEILGLDIYNLKQSWKSLKDDIIQKEGQQFIEKEDESFNLFEFKFNPDNVVRLLKKELNCKNFKFKILYDKGYKVIEIKSNKLFGEAIEYKDEIIYLTLSKKN